MSKVTNIIDCLSHNASLVKELAEKSITEKTEIMLRETRGQVAKEILSKNASDAVMASVTPQIKTTQPASAEKIVGRLGETQQIKFYQNPKMGLLLPSPLVGEGGRSSGEGNIRFENKVHQKTVFVRFKT